MEPTLLPRNIRKSSTIGEPKSVLRMLNLGLRLLLQLLLWIHGWRNRVVLLVTRGYHTACIH